MPLGKENQRMDDYHYPLSGYNFCVILDELRIGFTKVSGFALRNNPYSALHEGGQNHSVSPLRNEKKELNELVLEKGVGYFNPSKIKKDIQVMLLIAYDEKKTISKVYGFSGGVISKISVSEFDAMNSKTLLDTTTILYDFAFEIENYGKIIEHQMSHVSGAISSLLEPEASTTPSVDKIREHNEQIDKFRQEKDNERKKDLVY